MKIDKRYLAEILNVRKFYSKLKEIGLFTYTTDKEAGFVVVKEPEMGSFEVSDIARGYYFTLFNPNPDPDEYLNDKDEGSFFEIERRLHMYTLFYVHTHSGKYGPLVPSLTFDNSDGYPEGDLDSLKDDRIHYRQMLGYDVRPIMGIGKLRTPTQFDLFLVQEKTDKPLEICELTVVENAMKWYHESDQLKTLEESYQESQEVVEALKKTGFYNAEFIRYRGGRALTEDLEKLVEFEFKEIRLHSRSREDPFVF